MILNAAANFAEDSRRTGCKLQMALRGEHLSYLVRISPARRMLVGRRNSFLVALLNLFDLFEGERAFQLATAAKTEARQRRRMSEADDDGGDLLPIASLASLSQASAFPSE